MAGRAGRENVKRVFKKGEETAETIKKAPKNEKKTTGRGFSGLDIERIKKSLKRTEERIAPAAKGNCVKTGITGLDELFDSGGIPKGSSVIIAGGAGSGKTIMCLQILKNAALGGEKCLYMSFEESEGRLVSHMENFGWEPAKLIASGKLMIKRFSGFDINRSIDALLAKERGELLIDVKPVILPEGFKPERVVVDSLTAIASAFTGKEVSYRAYIEQLFRFFETLGATSFMITETKQVPTTYSPSGVEEFLADGVIVLYNFQKEDIRENGIEVLKMRGAKHKKKIVAMQITDEGAVVYPEQQVFGTSLEGK